MSRTWWIAVVRLAVLPWATGRLAIACTTLVISTAAVIAIDAAFH